MIHLLEPSRAKRLRQATQDLHGELDLAVMAVADGFATLDGYCRFLTVQHRFHRDVAPLYGAGALAAVIPGLAELGILARIEADLADLADLAQPLPEREDGALFSAETMDLPTALGWLYVAEGSKLGGAVLRAEAAKLGLSDQRGARHLAPGSQGVAAGWRSFVAALDGHELDEDEDLRAVEAARSAFSRVRQHVRDLAA